MGESFSEPRKYGFLLQTTYSLKIANSSVEQISYVAGDILFFWLIFLE